MLAIILSKCFVFGLSNAIFYGTLMMMVMWIWKHLSGSFCSQSLFCAAHITMSEEFQEFWICKEASQVLLPKLWIPTNVQLVVFRMFSHFMSSCVDLAKIIGTWKNASQKHSKLHRATADPRFGVICLWWWWFLWWSMLSSQVLKPRRDLEV